MIGMDLSSGATEKKQSPVTVSVDELLSYRQVAKSVRLRKKFKVVTERSGETQSRVLGRGLDFSELREYQAGDDIRQIDWNVTARTGKPHTKLFSLEREKPCFIVLDLRRTMFFATREAFKSVVAARLAAVLAWSAVQNNDRVGGLVFTDNAHVEIKPENGRRGLMRLFRAIVDNIAAVDSIPTKSRSFADAVTRLARLVHTGSTVWFLGDFQGFNDRVKAAFASVMQHNEVCAIQVLDIIERELPPPGRYRVKSGSQSLRMDTTSVAIRKEYQQQYDEFQQSLRRFFSSGRHRFLTVETHQQIDAQTELVLSGYSSVPTEMSDDY